MTNININIQIPLYDAHIHLKGVPFLEASLPKWFPTFICAKDVMVSPVVSLPRLCSMKRVLHVLSNKDFSHSAFPVVIDNPKYAANSQCITDVESSEHQSEPEEDPDAHLLIKTPKDKEMEKQQKEEKRKLEEEKLKKHKEEQVSRLSVDMNEYEKYKTFDGSHHLWIGLILRTHVMAMLKSKCYAPKDEMYRVQRLTTLELERLAFFIEIINWNHYEQWMKMVF